MNYTDADYAAAAWADGTRTLDPGTPPDPGDTGDYFAAAIWSYPTRTITSGIDPVTGTASGTSTASGVGSALAASAGTASGSSAAPGVGSSVAAGQGVGTATGTSTAAGTGASTAGSVGTASGTSAASGVGSSTSGGSGLAAGSAAGISSASGSGRSIAASTGTASGTSTASGVGSSAAPTFGLVGNWPRSIFPASIFPRSIFPGPASPAPPEPEPPAVAGPDWMVLDDVVARLLATRAFEDAAWGANLELLFPESSYPAAAVEYVGTTEAPISDIDFMVKDGRYTLTIAARGEDMRGRSAALQALAATARNALSGVSLAGICQPYFCRLREDGPAAASPPEARLRLVGSYRYTIEDDDSRDDSLD